MNIFKKTLTPTSIFLVFIFLIVPAFYQSASAAMIGTEILLTADRNHKTRDYLNHLISRKDIQKALVDRGVNPHEAEARINSLSDDEIEMIAGILADLPAGGDATGFVVIVGAVIIILIIIVEYFSEVKMFPQLYSDE